MRKHKAFIIFAFFVAMSLPMFGETYQSASCKMNIAGTSTLHDWDVVVNQTYAKGEMTVNNGDIQGVPNFYFDAVSKSIKSEKEAMDEKIFDALNVDKYAKITFQMTKLVGIQKTGNEWSIKTVGNLSIAGSTQQVDMDVKAKVMPNGNIEITGAKKLKMTAFGIKPPTAMLGMIKSGDDITISFTLTLKK